MFLILLATYGIPAGVALFVVYVALTHPQKLEYLWGWIGGKVSRAGTKLSRHSLGRRLDAHLNDFAVSAMSNLEHVELIGVRTEWLDDELDVRSALSADGDVVVYLNPSLPDGENLARAALAYIARQFIPRAKLSLTSRQRESMDLYVTGKLLDQQGSLVANEFYSAVLQPLVTADEQLADLVDTCSEIDRKGYFYPVLVQQLIFLSEKVAVGVPRDRVHEEVSAFVAWLRARSVRFDKDDTVPLFFRGTLITVGIVLVAKWEKAASGDATVFINSGVRYANDGFENVYVAGDTEYSRLIDETVAQIEVRTRMIEVIDTTFRAEHRLADSRIVLDRTRLVMLRSASVQRYVSSTRTAVLETDVSS